MGHDVSTYLTSKERQTMKYNTLKETVTVLGIDLAKIAFIYTV